MTEKSDSSFTKEFIEKAQEGDAEAFGVLFETFGERLRPLIYLRLGPGLRQRVEIEDVLQETFLKAYESLQQFEWRAPGSFFRWLGGIAEHVIQNLARYHLKTKKRMVARECSLNERVSALKDDSAGVAKILQDRGTSPSKGVRRNERFDRLEAALNHLSPDHREVILLAKLREMPVKEIARQMGRSPDAVSMLLLRALRELKKYFGSTDSLHLPYRSIDNRNGSSTPRENSREGRDS